MEKGNMSKKKLMFYIPLILQLVIHIVATFVTEFSGNSILLRILGSVIFTALYMIMGEGYAAVFYIVARSTEKVGAYAAVIIFSIIGAGANFAGNMIKGIEGDNCWWMTILFWCIDLFLFIDSIRRIGKLSSKKNVVGNKS